MSDTTDAHDGDLLLRIARAAIATRFGLIFESGEEADFLHRMRATFVTLTQAGRLRGCIGSLQPHRKLIDDVKANATAAAFRDPRFRPLDASEFNSTTIEVSLLSEVKAMAIQGETDTLAQLQPGIDGIIFECAGKRSTFLPQVWDSLPDPQQFLGELKRKAGLPPDFWSNDVRLFRYHVTKWTEQTEAANSQRSS